MTVAKIQRFGPRYQKVDNECRRCYTINIVKKRIQYEADHNTRIKPQTNPPLRDRGTARNCQRFGYILIGPRRVRFRSYPRPNPRSTGDCIMTVRNDIARMKAAGYSIQDIYIYVKDYIDLEQFSHLYNEV